MIRSCPPGSETERVWPKGTSALWKVVSVLFYLLACSSE